MFRDEFTVVVEGLNEKLLEGDQHGGVMNGFD
jgi:hypothetical protein